MMEGETVEVSKGYIMGVKLSYFNIKMLKTYKVSLQWFRVVAYYLSSR